MTSSCTSRVSDLSFPLEFLVSYDTNKFLMISSKDVEKISHFFSPFALGHLLGPLGPANHPLPLWILPLPLWILVSYSLDIVVTKGIAYNNKFVHLQIGPCKCQYLGALGPNRQWTHPLVNCFCFCGMVDRRKAFSLISSRDHCQRFSPSRISDTSRTGFEPAQNLNSGFVEWSCAVVITTIPRRQNWWPADQVIFLIFEHMKSTVGSNLIYLMGWSFLSWALRLNVLVVFVPIQYLWQCKFICFSFCWFEF